MLFNKKFFFIVVKLGLISSLSQTQTLTLGNQFLSDNIPARIQRLSPTLFFQFSENYTTQLGYCYYFAHQDSFNGLPQYRKTLHSIWMDFGAYFFQRRLELCSQGTVNASPENPPTWDYLLTLQYSQTIAETFSEKPIKAKLRGEMGQHRELTVSSALHENISYNSFALQMELEWLKSITITGRYLRQFYSDENQKTVAYAYALVNIPIANPLISFGYAYAYSNSLFDNWRLTDTRRIAFNPITREATYQYSYFYYPYFTPIKEHGHIAIGIFQWQVVNHLLLFAKATIPFSSWGQLKYFPSTGNKPEPIDYGIYYIADGLQPTQYEVSIINTVLNPLTVRLDFEYFEKPYYIYRKIGIQLQHVFK